MPCAQILETLFIFTSLAVRFILPTKTNSKRDKIFAYVYCIWSFYLCLILLILILRVAKFSIALNCRHYQNPHHEIKLKNRSPLLSKEKKAHLILTGEVHLIHIIISRKGLRNESGYQGIKGVFCPLNWSHYKSNPSSSKLWLTLLIDLKID